MLLFIAGVDITGKFTGLAMALLAAAGWAGVLIRARFGPPGHEMLAPVVGSTAGCCGCELVILGTVTAG
jgi:hypothetical protein